VVGFVGVTPVVVGRAVVVVGAAVVVVGAAVVVVGAAVVVGAVVVTHTGQHAPAWFSGRNPSGHVGQVGLIHTISPTFLPALNRHTHCSQLSVHVSPITYVLLLYTQTGACVVVGAAVVVGADVVVGAAVVVVGAAVVVFGTHVGQHLPFSNTSV